jgi:hypothetical protein
MHSRYRAGQAAKAQKWPRLAGQEHAWWLILHIRSDASTYRSPEQLPLRRPLTVIEQITFLMYARLLDINETRDENRTKRTGKSFEPLDLIARA